MSATTGGGFGSPTGTILAAVDYTAGIMVAGDYYYAQTFTDGAGGETPLGPATAVYVNPGYASAQVDLSGLWAAAPANAATTRLWRSYQVEDWHLAV